MRRVKQPLNPAAAAKADAAVGNRKLDPTSPADAAARKQWMDAYIAAGGETQESAQNNAPVMSPVQPCCKPTIDLKYLQCNGQPVAGAKFDVCSVDPKTGKKDGVYSKSGTLDGNGCYHEENVPDIIQLQFSCYNDPKPYTILEEHKTKAKADLPATESALHRFGDWSWQAAQGDFNEDQEISHIAANMVVGLIPVVDQAMDIRDLIANSMHLLDFYSQSEEEQKKQNQETTLGLTKEDWLWVAIFLTAVGCIPELGSVIKGVLKTVLKSALDAAKKLSSPGPNELKQVWEVVIQVLNYFGVGNAHQWLKEFPGKLAGWMDKAAETISKTLDSLDSLLSKAAWFSERAKNLRTKVTKCKAKLADMKTKLTNFFKEQVEKAIGGKERETLGGATGLPGQPVENLKTQIKTPPPELPTPTEYVLGRQVDTAVAKNWPGHSTLDIPDWTIAKNDAWIQNIIDSKGTVYLGSPQTQSTLWDAVNNRPTVYARELEQLRKAGYVQVGDYMFPP